MAKVEVLTSPSGKSVYAIDDFTTRVLLWYIAPDGRFFAARPDCEPFHRQRWNEHLKLCIENVWIGKEIMK